MTDKQLDDLRALAREQLRDEYRDLRDARVRLWLSGRRLSEAREGKKRG